MTRKQTRMLRRILISVATLAVVWVLCAFVPLPWYAQLALYLIPYLIIGYDVLRKAFLGVVQGEIFDENFLMAIATVGALVLQEYQEAAAVMLFYQIGELFQSYAVGKSRKNIAALMDIRPDYANLETSEGVQQVDPDTVAVGDVILIRPGEKIPLDGVVLEGSGTINTSALTGESRPRRVSPGDDVISGCVNQDEVLRVKVSKPFGQSTVARILELVENFSLKKAKAENFITKFARYYTPAVCIGAAALAILPSLFTGQWGVWVSRALTFLVISCPCALVISIPLTFFGGIGGASRSGILIKGGNYLEALAQVKTIVFDKTGTLTQGVFQVTGVFPAEGFTEEALLETAALAESWSNHPIAQSLRAAWGKPGGFQPYPAGTRGSRSRPDRPGGRCFGGRRKRPSDGTAGRADPPKQPARRGRNGGVSCHRRSLCRLFADQRRGKTYLCSGHPEPEATGHPHRDAHRRRQGSRPSGSPAPWTGRLPCPAAAR